LEGVGVGFKEVVAAINPLSHSEITSIDSLRSFLILRQSQQSPVFVVAPNSRVADLIKKELNSITGSEVTEYLAWETLPHERLSPKGDTVTNRIKVLTQIQSKNPPQIVITSIRGLLQPISKSIIDTKPIHLEANKTKAMDQLLNELVYFGFSRTDLVERRGDFAVRGGIVDLFPTDAEHPIRIDFFGDDIETINYFAVADQRTFEEIKEITIFPLREILIDEKVRKKAEYLAAECPQLTELAGKVAQGIYAEGMESLIGALKDDLTSLVEILPMEYAIITLDENRTISRAKDLVSTNLEFFEAAWSSAAIGTESPIDLGVGYFDYQELKTSRSNWYAINSYGLQGVQEFSDFKPSKNYGGNADEVIVDIGAWHASKIKVIFTAQGRGIIERYQDLFKEAGITGIEYQVSALEHGFINEELKIAVITEKDVSGAKSTDKDQARMPSRRKKTIDPLELKLGDFVVHEQHGVGKYVELIQRQVNGISREYLVIEYAAAKRGQPGDRLFVPTDTLEQITKYVGGEAPTLNRIGGADWQNTKRRARKAVKQIAAELIQLYAARMSAPGFAFSPDNAWQRELEDAFNYVETTDQLSTIEEVKHDMEQPHPMDRVVCGDVGYGKTEIAVRAAFKAVQDMKQVAVLVPTTLLVQQHLNTFESRYAGFPVRVVGLSRFNTAKEVTQTLDGLKKGSIDVVIGTHRLLSKDVEFKDLGLVIVDEEQRFGVEHKEELKKARTNVDFLSMSATPIPRTLEMAITGIREMSNITTPPEERHPVLTYVGFYDEKQIVAAIHRELLRDGQVFFIHNRVESIDQVVGRLSTLIPEARIRYAHGQMGEKQLEEVILGFWNRDFDVLVCTTIIESGIDIPNANTLIVDRADSFGLSQLHQLRGRVGRSRDRAYAYFLYSPDKPLTEIAHDRLATIATNSELGAGMQVALKDLEIRGAGNLLGGEQSGHIAEVGFDLYMRMVSEAVSEFKTGIVADTNEVVKECKVELPITAHLPVEYVSSERLRLDLYRRIADTKSKEELNEIESEMVDRFGNLPDEAKTLLEVADLRNRAKDYELEELVLQGKFLRLSPITLPESATLRLTRMYPGSLVKAATNTVLVARKLAPNWIEGSEVGDTSALTWANEVLENIVTPTRKKY
jgi:transcription-repair coupling factor (superfamily II helicase)